MTEQVATAGAMADLIASHRPVIRVDAWATVVGCQCMDRVFVAGHEDFAGHIVAVLGPLIREAKAQVWDECVVAATGGGLTALAEMLRDDNPYRAPGLPETTPAARTAES